jgi:hypothetical protein
MLLGKFLTLRFREVGRTTVRIVVSIVTSVLWWNSSPFNRVESVVDIGEWSVSRSVCLILSRRGSQL